MTTLYLSHELSQQRIEEIQQRIEEMLLQDPSWSGGAIDIGRDDWTWIDDDSIESNVFMAEIVLPIINGDG